MIGFDRINEQRSSTLAKKAMVQAPTPGHRKTAPRSRGGTHDVPTWIPVAYLGTHLFMRAMASARLMPMSTPRVDPASGLIDPGGWGQGAGPSTGLNTPHQTRDAPRREEHEEHEDRPE